MTTLEIIQRIWSLIPPPAPDGSIEVRELETSADETSSVRLAIDQQGQRHLLILATSGARLLEDRRSSGVHLLAADWGDEDAHRRFVDLVCLKPHLNGLFDLIIFEVLSALKESHGHPDRICLAVLNQWRELLSRDSSPLPERSAVIGLFGELTTFRSLARINPLVLPIWTGPDGGRFDFYAGGQALEVKTTLRRQGVVLTIHGHDQLEILQSGSLHVAVLLIEETPVGGENLRSLIEAISNAGVSRVEIYRKLARLGFTPDILSLLDDQRFKLSERRVYHVDDGFPRITASSFVGASLPRGVTSISYTIDLSVPPPHPLIEANAEAVLAALADSAS
ncbi:MAG: PD-(D/E)XK motif protein [Anaerolineae bacterium]|nr:PD-(D/E)XK motif protein [Anaerolineae bacterium]NUQ04676.1 PD-(D/E)XK motif protein [Anaerolineae bacterium]